MYTKLTDGTGGVDHTGKDYAERAQSVGMLAGWFAYLQPGDGAVQARHFLSVAGDMTGMLLPCLDAEQSGVNSATCRGFADTIKAELGFAPLLYCSLDWARNVLRGLTDCPLWLADWTAKMPSGPYGQWDSCALWQYTGTDLDRDKAFFGSLDIMRSGFTVGAPKPTDGLGVVVLTPAGVWTLAACNPVLNSAAGVTDVDYAPIAALLGVPVVDGMLPRGPVRSFPGIQVTAHLDAQREYVYPTPAPGFPVIAADGKVAS
jgi:hypothetical protein